MAQPHPDDVKIKKEQIANGTGGICKWCKRKFDTDSRLWKDKFGNWMHCHCHGDMRETYFKKKERREIRQSLSRQGLFNTSSSNDIYGGTA